MDKDKKYTLTDGANFPGSWHPGPILSLRWYTKTDTVRASLDSNMLELYAINFML